MKFFIVTRVLTRGAYGSKVPRKVHLSFWNGASFGAKHFALRFDDFKPAGEETWSKAFATFLSTKHGEFQADVVQEVSPGEYRSCLGD
jgi:hypothetical protein